jgi:hypothetical protein
VIRTKPWMALTAAFCLGVFCLTCIREVRGNPSDPPTVQVGTAQFEYGRLRCVTRANGPAQYTWESGRTRLAAESPDGIAKQLATIKAGQLDLTDLFTLLGTRGWLLVQRWRDSDSPQDVETYLFYMRRS